MSLNRCVLFFAACAGWLACANATEPVRAYEASEDWTLLEKGTQCAISEAGQDLIDSQEELERTWQRTFEGVDMAPEIPAVDFAAHQVVVAYLGGQRSGGHEIDIQEIAREPDRVVITVRHVKPGPGCVTTMAIETPYLFARVKRLGVERVTFETVVSEKSCE